MFRVPDEATLSLCATFASLCFSVTFLALRLRQPSQMFWSYWAASGAAYIIGVVAFNELPGPPTPFVGAMLFGSLCAATILTFVGLRAFAGLTPWRWWIAALLLLPPLLYLTTAVMLPGAMTPAGIPMQRLAGGIGLTLVLTTCGIALVRGAGAPRGSWFRWIGIAYIAHLPSYTTVLASAYATVPGADDLTSCLWMSQPILMLAINLSLLAMPGMVAIERLRHLVSRDGLTGLHNRHWLRECEAARATTGSHVAMIDLDGFKGVNDRCGHAAGDALLVAFAAHLRRWADGHRGEVVRLGGDEFLVLFPLGDDALAPALLRHVAAAPHGHDDLPPWSASIGVGTCPAGSATLAAAMHDADGALYHVKRDRRAARARAA